MINAWARPTPSPFSGTNNISAENEGMLMSVWIYVKDFWNEHSAWFLLFIALAAFIKIMFNGLQREQNQIEKIWKFLLFFLSKRQMMLPLVHTLASRDHVLEERALQQILDIRSECAHCSFRKTPQERMKLEKHVSRILFHYFSKLEKTGKIKPQSKLSHLVQDLEFIDEKLIQLQKIYNREAGAWNRKFRFFPKTLLPLRRFELFE